MQNSPAPPNFAPRPSSNNAVNFDFLLSGITADSTVNHIEEVDSIERGSTAPPFAVNLNPPLTLEETTRAASVGFASSESMLSFTNDFLEMGADTTVDGNMEESLWGMELELDRVVKEEDSIFQF